MSKSVLVIGLGRFGRHLITTLEELNHEVLAVDSNEERVNSALQLTANAMIGDCTKEEFLKTLGVRNFDVCYVAIGDDFQSSLETTSLLKELGAKTVVSRAASGIQEKFLLRNGADQVVYPEHQLANWAAIRYTADHVFDYVEIDGDYAVFEVEVPKNWIGKAVVDLDIRKKRNINILGIRKNDILDMKVTPELVLEEGMSLYVLGTYSDVDRCFDI